MKNIARSSLVLLVLAALLPACREEDPNTPTGDAGVRTEDASTSTTDVARCVALARTFRDHCAAANGPTDVRVCLWEGYADLCATGNTALLIAAMECFDDTQCRTFSDPNEGGACLDALHAAQQPPAIRDFVEGRCSACGGTECGGANGRLEIFPYLLETAAPSLETCAASACSIDDMIDGCASAVPALAAFQCAG